MKELYEFRIDNDYAHLLFKEDEGEKLGLTVRKIIISPEDPRFARIGEIRKMLSREGKGLFFFSWTCNRSYTKSELQSARIFRMLSTSMFEPCGEDCGTKYDGKKECRYCGAGAKLVGALRLDTKCIPKGVDIATTIAKREIVISEKLKNLFEAENVTGIEMKPVVPVNKSHERYGKWYQLNVLEPFVSLARDGNLTGNNVFELDEAGEYRCRIKKPGHVAALNLLSEVYIDESTWSGADICVTGELFGKRMGMLHPVPKMIVSSRVRNILLENKIRKLDFEVAHLV